jgi:hypothetical protein
MADDGNQRQTIYNDKGLQLDDSQAGALREWEDWAVAIALVISCYREQGSVYIYIPMCLPGHGGGAPAVPRCGAIAFVYTHSTRKRSSALVMSSCTWPGSSPARARGCQHGQVTGAFGAYLMQLRRRSSPGHLPRALLQGTPSLLQGTKTAYRGQGRAGLGALVQGTCPGTAVEIFDAAARVFFFFCLGDYYISRA